MATTLPLRTPLSWFIALTFFLLCLGFLGFRSFSSFLLTSIALIMSMLYFSISKRNSLPIQKFVQQVQEEEEEEDQKKLTFFSDHLKSSSVSAPTTGDLLSESECADDNFTTTEESEVEWPYFDHRSYKPNNPDRSDDGSISDEESLIEIALPTGHYVSHKFDDVDDEDEDGMSFRYQKLSDFQKKNLVEVLAEINDINEEENLIEIDISMGSIKYSRFEIEA
ncbi:uncharacterized protein LOC120089322 [Benincasa hispida]|uniref:uncharacterized protein LOC120089322 n=1 Tax=Benincasa hispida TaxID=102211 RepID=UPI0018FF9878|nr:uncharacterized protein LOC120089322 [Benincasa hispida]